MLFREGDKDKDELLDYGTLRDLADHGVVDDVLGSGTRQGYQFVALPSQKEPEFLWVATATPAVPGTTGDRYFMTNHSGVIYFALDRPFAADPDAPLPEGALAVGR